MTAKCALIQSLLNGDVINIKTCFRNIGITNAPREISRMVEQPFKVIVSRSRMEGKSRYGTPVCWFNYRLNKTGANAEGIEKMKAYVAEQKGTTIPTKNNSLKQSDLFS